LDFYRKEDTMMKHVCRLVKIWMFFLLAASSAWAQSVPGQNGGGRLVVLGDRPAPEFFQAVKSAGWMVLPEKELRQADAICIITYLRKSKEESREIASDVAAALKAGKSLIIGFGPGGWVENQAGDFESLLPVNLWSLAQWQYRRGECAAVPVKGSRLAEGFQAGDLKLSARYDLHLPFNLIEAGEHRHQWPHFGKDLLNTDWQVHWRCDQEGLLPLLVSGRVGPGKVLCFAGSLSDKGLVASPKYSEFIRVLLQAVRPVRLAPEPPPLGLSLSIITHGTRRPTVVVRNSQAVPAQALLAYKVRNAERALLNSATLPVNIAPRAELAIELPERYDQLADAAMLPSADRLPFRHIEAGLTTLNRTRLLATATAVVDLHPAVTLEIQGQDIRDQEDLKSWPERSSGPGYSVGDGAPIYSYVYKTGTTPKLRLALRNGLHNIAPLAEPKDVANPDNPTIQGVNDLAYSRNDVRGVHPLYGTWSARPDQVGNLALNWNIPVTVAGQRLAGWGGVRSRNPAEQARYALFGQKPAGSARLTERQGLNEAQRRQEDAFTPVVVTGCRLDFQGSPKPEAGKSGGSLVEWEVLGWPDANPLPAAAGELAVKAVDPRSGKTWDLLKEPVTVASQQELIREITVPTKGDFGPLRIDAVFTPAAGRPPVLASFELLFIPPGRDAIRPVAELDEVKVSPLCSPGFMLFDDFGLGTQADTRGWGGADDQIWAYAHDFLEVWPKSLDSPRRMFTSAGSCCHYTFAWRDFPSGEYYWDHACDELLKKFAPGGRYAGKKTFRAFLSDRWSGYSPGAMFSWADYIRFDEYLRAQGKPGLTARSRRAIADEICSRYGDQWQRWQMTRYADKLLEYQRRFEQVGVSFKVTTHGAFPLVGGELGRKLAKTHVAVGTDLFWELKNEDLYYSLGQCFGIVAANPDLESGAYNEWGWVSAALTNAHFYSEAGSVEPSRRQWYSTYFAGRVDSAGQFKPYHVYGFDAQGSFDIKNTINDWQQYYRTMRLVCSLRPEQPAGIGLVVSWRWQERRMGPETGPMGFGIYPTKGKPMVSQQAGNAWHQLVKAGVPITFVTSTSCLKNWQGRNPLVIIDGYNLEPWELQELARLNRAGVHIACAGLGEGEGAPAARELFGPVSQTGACTFIRRPGRGTTLLMPNEPDKWTSSQANEFGRQLLLAAGSPVQASPGVVVFPLISNDKLLLSLNSQSDVGRMVSVQVRPALLKPELTGQRFRVIDIDRATVLESRWENDVLEFQIPMAACDGRLVLIEKEVQP
jgi:hypothetical protein